MPAGNVHFAIIVPQRRPDILAAVNLAFNNSLAAGNLIFEKITTKIYDTSPEDSGPDFIDLISRICRDTTISDATRPDVILPLGLTIFTTCALGDLSMNLDAGVMSTTKFACSPLELQTGGGDGGETSISVPSVRPSDSAITAAMAEFSHLLLGALHESIVFIDDLIDIRYGFQDALLVQMPARFVINIVGMNDQALAIILADLLTKTEASAWFLATNTTSARRILRLFPRHRLASGHFCPIGVPCNWLLFDGTEEMRDCADIVSSSLKFYPDAELSAVQFFCVSRSWDRTSPNLLAGIIQAVGASWANMTESERLQTIFSYEATFSAAHVLQNLIFRKEWNISRSKEPCSVENPPRNETSYMYKFAEEVRRTAGIHVQVTACYFEVNTVKTQPFRILDLQTEQVLEILKQKWLSYGAVQCPPPTKDPGFRPDQIAGVFIVLCVGYVLSLVVLLVEFLTAWLLRKYNIRLHPSAFHSEELCQEKAAHIESPVKTGNEKTDEMLSRDAAPQPSNPDFSNFQIEHY
ncbi:hypothetical protein SprV_0301151000 [Sparganum proliferum]